MIFSYLNWQNEQQQFGYTYDCGWLSVRPEFGELHLGELAEIIVLISAYASAAGEVTKAIIAAVLAHGVWAWAGAVNNILRMAFFKIVENTHVPA